MLKFSLIGLLLAGILALIACGAPKPGGEVASSPTAPIGSTTLSCTTRTLTVGAPEMQGATLVCAVAGAASTATSFSLTATLANAQGSKRDFSHFCTGTLTAGTGSCVGNIIAPYEEWGGSLSVSGVLSPGGEPLGPITLSQAKTP